MKINCIDKNSELFPYELKNIYKSPDKIYASGDLSLLGDRSVAVVGARDCSDYGKCVSEIIGARLALNDVTHISGMAKGIDSYSHKGVLNKGGKTIAVLGFGMDKCYPRENSLLMEKIYGKGLLISEYENDFEGSKYSFPMRNRIISALSESIVIVEAEYKSGSLITANFGLEQGKNIYAVPGNINNKKSLGTNLLIREGAIPLFVIDDLIRDLGIKPKLDNIYSLGKDEIKVLEAINEYDGIGIEKISHKININVNILSGILTILTIKGSIISLGGKFFIAK
ncbi:MAG TPA: DNA-processing protein DprA [Anaerovoracaceae bacterium]|nr:DNA-processing protein DprA [Anaerovoracaceae bacterium]